MPQAFWAVWDREARAALGAHGRAPRPASTLPDGAVRVADREVSLDLVLEPAGEPVEVVSRHGASYIWTRKPPVRATGLVTLEGRTLAVDARGLIDDSAGYHARHTAWQWSAGVGIATERRGGGVEPRGRRARRAARQRAHGVGRRRARARSARSRFAEGLDAVGDLRFSPEAERVRRDDLLLVASDYRQPFGTFAGTLPGGTELASGYGVMERHARAGEPRRGVERRSYHL